MYFTSHGNTNAAVIYILFSILNWQFNIAYFVFSWLMGMAPDLDVLLEIRRHYAKDVYHHHEYIPHKPLFWYVLILVGSGVNLYFHFFRWEYILIAFIGVPSHFLMDGIGEAPGEGVEWLWPFTNKKFGPWLIARDKSGQPIDPMKWYQYYFRNPYFITWEVIGLIAVAWISSRVF